MGTDKKLETEVREEVGNETVQRGDTEECAGNADGKDCSSGCEEELPKKSDLIREQIELEKQYESESVKVLEDTYNIKFGSKANFDRLYKMIEHEFEFDYQTATAIALLYSNLKQQKPFTREDDWNGSVILKSSSCLMLWRFITTYKGRGYFEAKSFLEMIQHVGPEVAKACNTINDKQNNIRGLHLRLDEIDNIIDSGKYISDLTEEEEKSLTAELKGVIKAEEQIEEEVNPTVVI